MKVGIVGFSQAGKSTLFEALTGVEPDPGKVMKGQVGETKVADPRLDFLANMFQPKKTTPGTVVFVDTPGLIRGEQADNPQRLSTLRTADGLLIVLDDFSGAGKPAEQLSAFLEELNFADYTLVGSRIERLQAGSKKPKPAAQKAAEEQELTQLQQVAERLENNQSIAGLTLSEDVEKTMRSFQLFTLKPQFVVINVAEAKLHDPPDPKVLTLAPNSLATAVKLERDLAQLDGDDKTMFMEELGVKELAKDRIIKQAYDAVGLCCFFTVGEDECRAWPIKVNTPAVEAAGKIHSDIARGFIRAEVTAYKDLFELGSMKEVRAKGLGRLEGKEYIVADGDIINFRFSV